MNDLYFTAKNKKACKDENYPGKPIFFAKKPIKKGNLPHFDNKKAIIPIFFVSILWFLYGRNATFAIGETRFGLPKANIEAWNLSGKEKDS